MRLNNDIALTRANTTWSKTSWGNLETIKLALLQLTTTQTSFLIKSAGKLYLTSNANLVSCKTSRTQKNLTRSMQKVASWIRNLNTQHLNKCKKNSRKWSSRRPILTVRAAQEMRKVKSQHAAGPRMVQRELINFASKALRNSAQTSGMSWTKR